MMHWFEFFALRQIDNIKSEVRKVINVCHQAVIKNDVEIAQLNNAFTPFFVQMTDRSYISFWFNYKYTVNMFI